jgi:hypothetical protein
MGFVTPFTCGGAFELNWKARILPEGLDGGGGQLKQIAWPNAPHHDHDNHHRTENGRRGREMNGW